MVEKRKLFQNGIVITANTQKCWFWTVPLCSVSQQSALIICKQVVSLVSGSWTLPSKLLLPTISFTRFRILFASFRHRWTYQKCSFLGQVCLKAWNHSGIVEMVPKRHCYYSKHPEMLILDRSLVFRLTGVSFICKQVVSQESGSS